MVWTYLLSMCSRMLMFVFQNESHHCRVKKLYCCTDWLMTHNEQILCGAQCNGSSQSIIIYIWFRLYRVLSCLIMTALTCPAPPLGLCIKDHALSLWFGPVSFRHKVRTHGTQQVVYRWAGLELTSCFMLQYSPKLRSWFEMTKLTLLAGKAWWDGPIGQISLLVWFNSSLFLRHMSGAMPAG